MASKPYNRIHNGVRVFYRIIRDIHVQMRGSLCSLSAALPSSSIDEKERVDVH
jgi:hypothetical protein